MSRPRVRRTVAGSRAWSSTALNAAIALARRAVEGARRVVRDQVHLEDLRVEQLRELGRLLDAVVDAGEHHVLDEHLPPAQPAVAAALGDDVLERVAVVDRHQLAAQRVGRRMQRQREPDRLLHLVDEPAQSRQPADGGDRRPAVGDAEIRQATRRLEHVVEVEHRLAHPHEHDVVDRLDAAEVERLVEDLRRRQVAAEAHLTGRAERARQRAARLRRDADRAPSVPVAHEHRLDRMAVARAEERLQRAVLRMRLVLDRQRRERDVLREPRAERRRNVRHLVVAGCAARGPFPDLAARGRPARPRGLRRAAPCPSGHGSVRPSGSPSRHGSPAQLDSSRDRSSLRYRDEADAAPCARRWRTPRSATTRSARIRPCSSSSGAPRSCSGRRTRSTCRRRAWRTRSRAGSSPSRATSCSRRRTRTSCSPSRAGRPSTRGSSRDRSARRPGATAATTCARSCATGRRCTWRARGSSRSRTRTTRRAGAAGGWTRSTTSSRPRASST